MDQCTNDSKVLESVSSRKKRPTSSTVTEGMDTGIGKLADHVFNVWGGRSRTPSVDEVDAEPDKEKCRGGPGKPQCGEPVRDGENGIECDKCHFWYHGACHLIPKTAVAAAGKFPMLHWFCTACHASIFNSSADDKPDCLQTKEAFDNLEKKIIKGLNDKVEVLSQSISEHCKLVNLTLRQLEEHAVDQKVVLERTLRQQEEVKTSYADIVKNSCSVLKDTVEKKLSGLAGDNKQRSDHISHTSGDIHETINTVLDRERRKLNVVVFNLPENAPTADETRETKDLRTFTEIIKESLKLSVRASKCHRVGKMQENRPRLLIVTLADLDTKLELLRLSHQLRQTEEWSRLYINADQTPAERETYRQLRQELARRRAAGEQDIVIRKGSIVKLNHGVVQNPVPSSSHQALPPTHPSPGVAQTRLESSNRPRTQ